MELIRGIYNIRAEHKGCVLTIGNFDGVHLGHQSVLAGLIEDAKALNSVPTVMIFEPQPQEVFAGDKAPARISRLRDKLQLLEKSGVERVICVKFNLAFAGIDAQYFIEKILVGKLGVKALTVGDDFRFGRGREGDFTMLEKASQSFGFSVKNTKSYRRADCRVSSTAIRKALSEGNFSLATTMLGRQFKLSGRVIHGQKQGRKLGFPTANVAMKRKRTPVHGVYAVKVSIRNICYAGVANIGNKPTLNGQKCLLEVHVFDFNDDLYGQVIDVELVKKIRNEIKFESVTALASQIQLDVESAKASIKVAGTEN